jgi:8-oxo-dGTP diphosphatase
VKKKSNVVGAVIVREGLTLCAQSGPGSALPGMWEFPGGKIEAGETRHDALARESSEELRCEVAVGELITTTVHEYDFGIVALTTFYCKLLSGTPALTEHSEVRWLVPANLTSLEWAPADIPAVELIEKEARTG